MSRNVALICLDAVRKDYFDEFAPRLQEYADVSFDQCRSASSCSVPSHASILTGELPHQNGVNNYDAYYDNVPHSATFLSDFEDHRTFGVSANVWASSEFGFGRYFDEFVEVSPYRRFQDGIDVKQFALNECGERGVKLYSEFLKAAIKRDHTLQSISNAVAAQLDQLLSESPLPKFLDDGAKIVSRQIRKQASTEEPFFFFANFMDAHGPMHHIVGFDKELHGASNTWSSLSFDHIQEVTYNLEGATDRYRDFIETYRSLYAASIDYLDRRVSSLVRDVQSTTQAETTFIITADHGENLGYEAEDCMFGHKSSLSEGLLHVPCYIINPPKGFEQREKRLFTHLDLGELILALAEDDCADVFRSKVPAELTGKQAGKIAGIVSEEEYNYHSRAQRCVISGEEKILWDSLGACSLYELDPDRPGWQQKCDELVEIPQWCLGEFGLRLREFLVEVEGGEQQAPEGEIDEHTRDRLEDLGYL